jgi:CheY-like chemotaxis protein
MCLNDSVPPPTILVVEDEAVIAMGIEHSLRQSGYEVVGIAVSGEQAIQLCQAHLPDLVLMDIRLEGEMTGLDAAARIKRELDIPIIFLTSLSDRATVEQAKTTGPVGYLSKPILDCHLRPAIEVALSNHQTEQSLRASSMWFLGSLASLGAPVLAANVIGQIWLLNPAAQWLTGWTEEEMMGKQLEEIVSFPGINLEGAADGTRNRAVLTYKNGDRKTIGCRVTPIRVGGRNTGYMVLLQSRRTAGKTAPVSTPAAVAPTEPDALPAQ